MSEPTGRVVLVGEPPLVDELARLCADAGLFAGVYRVEEASAAGGLERMQRDAQHAEVAIDAMSESLDAKRRIVTALEDALPAQALLLASLLSATATHIGSWLREPGRLVGFAALPPLAKGGMVELAAGLRTESDGLDRAHRLFARLGVHAVAVHDSVGLVLPRIVCTLANEAAAALAEGVADAPGIDLAMKLGTNYPRGPLEWADLIGLDVVLSLLRGLHEETGEDRYRPAPLLKQYVRAGWLGKKTGRGFHHYR